MGIELYIVQGIYVCLCAFVCFLFLSMSSFYFCGFISPIGGSAMRMSNFFTSLGVLYCQFLDSLYGKRSII